MPQNGIRLFRVFGITVFLHWSWLAVAAYQLSTGENRYSSQLFHVGEYLGLFGIVLLHEFGHALACRSVGGRAEKIMLWPLGGVAYVDPPQRPGAVLWSIAAGPLVNVALLPVLGFFWFHPLGGDLGRLLWMLAAINAFILAFNLLPIYPLDGGQILQSLLWFVMGRAWSLTVATAIGMAGAVAMAGAAIYTQNWWLGLLALFAASRCWAGWKYATELRRHGVGDDRPPAFPVVMRRTGFACPRCGRHPPAGPYWACASCHARLDKFDYPFGCPACGHADQTVPCPDCGVAPPYAAWRPWAGQAAGGTPLAQGELIDG
jgi:Zn-dependent protease